MWNGLLNHIAQVDLLWPWMLALLPLPWLLRFVIKPVKQQQSPLLAPQIIQRINGQMPEQSLIDPQQQKSRLSVLAVLLWISLILAATRPVYYLDSTPFEASGKEMMLAVDLSGSMQKTDMYLGGDEVNRLLAVKAVVSEFINQRRGDRMGLIVFGSQAFLQSPLTYDLNTVKTLLMETEIGMAGNNTAIGDAIGLSLKHLNQYKQQQKLSDSVLILLTDGSNTDGEVDPFDAAQQAKKMGLKIYTVGVGKVRSRVGLDNFLAQKPDMDIEALTQIAKITGGAFFQANDTKQLAQIYQHINQLESVEHDIYSYRLRSELYIWPLALALLLSFFAAAWRFRSAL
ncbi:VWA domain-containing protein [Thiomicrorhabdus sediminis]|uniref:VWA domain-containing protein n=1 Tax=Thiomicrorhabdus sediminis TaxID=2580412 RepID=A0A4P9K4P2_9GAMM|nr:VWA domain-containing protein [Thiomicrorhabdus sediminis]QCU89177.1 VWA domain-containing protein [Thiomicrorhabdus sediminis]